MEGYKTGLYNNIKVLIILYIPIDAKTNINRVNIQNKKYATYRTNKAYVLHIVNKSNHEYDHAISRFNSNKIIYNRSTIIENNFDDNIDNINSEGIHFFLDKELAINYREPILKQIWLYENNIYKDYYNNGQLHKKIKYVYDSVNKIITHKHVQEYYENSNIKLDYKLHINKYNGQYKEWYKNGNLKKRLFYEENKIIGYVESWNLMGIKNL